MTVYLFGWTDTVFLRCPFFPPWFTDSFPVKIPANYFSDINILILGFIWRVKRSRISNSVLKEKSKAGGLTLSNFKIYYKATGLKTVWYWGKKETNTSMKQNREPRIDPHKNSQLISEKVANQHNRAKSLSNKWCLNNWTHTHTHTQI